MGSYYGYGDLGYDEVDITADGAFEHRLQSHRTAVEVYPQPREAKPLRLEREVNVRTHFRTPIFEMQSAINSGTSTDW